MSARDEIVHAIGTGPVDYLNITDDQLRELLRVSVYGRQIGPYNDIMDALVLEPGGRRIEARKRCAELWRMLVEKREAFDRANAHRPPPTAIPGAGERGR